MSDAPSIENLLSQVKRLEIWECSQSQSGFSTRVALFRSIQDEPEVEKLEAWILKNRGEVSYPRVVRLQQGVMEFVPAQTQNVKDWKRGAYGILEPLDSIPSWPAVSLQIICVPGKYFGLRGERQGRGAGFYDRYLAQAPQAVRIGISWESQLREGLSQSAWDQPMDWVVTEKRAIRGTLRSSKRGLS